MKYLQPESYFDLERLREVRLGDFVVRIQKAWRAYFNSKAFVVLQRSMAKLFAEQKKARRRDSIYRFISFVCIIFFFNF